MIRDSIFFRRKRFSPRGKEMIGILILLLLIFIVYFIYKFNLNSIRENPAVTVGYIYEVTSRGGKQPGVAVWYSYVVGGITHKSFNSYGTLSNNGSQEMFTGKTFPVIYQQDRPDNSNILINKEDFAMFSLSFPDSLLWVKTYFPSQFN